MDARLARARALLERGGVAARVESAGHEGEIAAITAPPTAVAKVRALAPELRALGYRYVAVDLASRTESDDQEAQ